MKVASVQKWITGVDLERQRLADQVGKAATGKAR